MSRFAHSTSALKGVWLATRAAAPLSARISGRLSAVLWFTPWQVPVSDRAKARRERWLRNTRPVTLDSPYGRLDGFAAGAGPKVLLVHGWGEVASSMGAFVAPLTAAGFSVVGVDLPAHGSSSKRQTDGLEIADAIEAVAAQVGPVHAVISHSLGAHATTIALARGLDVEGVALLSPSVRLDSALKPFARMFSLPPAALEGLRREIERRFGSSVWMDLAADSLAVHVDTPALVVHDRSDVQVSLADAEALVAAWSGARLHVTDGLGHAKGLSDTSVVAEVVSWLSALRPSGEAEATNVTSPLEYVS